MPLTNGQKEFIKIVLEDFLDFPDNRSDFDKTIANLLADFENALQGKPAEQQLIQLLMFPTRYFLRLEDKADRKTPATIGEVQCEILSLISNSIAAKEKSLGMTTPWTEEALLQRRDFLANKTRFETEIDKTPAPSPWELESLTDHIYQHSCSLVFEHNQLIGNLRVEVRFPGTALLVVKEQRILPKMPDGTYEAWAAFREKNTMMTKHMAMECIIEEWKKDNPTILQFIPQLIEHTYNYSIITHVFYYNQLITNKIPFAAIVFLNPTQAEFFKKPTIIGLQKENLADFSTLAKTPPEIMGKLSSPTVHLLLKHKVCDLPQLWELSPAALNLVTQQAYAKWLSTKRIDFQDCMRVCEDQVAILSLPPIIFALEQRKLLFRDALRLNKALKAILTSSWYADYFKNPLLKWTMWPLFKPYHAPLFLDKTLAPLIAQNNLSADEILMLSEAQCAVFNSPLQPLLICKRITLTELKALSSSRISTLLNSPVLQDLLLDASSALRIISIDEATRDNPDRYTAYAKALARQCSRALLAKKEMPHFERKIQCAAKESGVSWYDFMNVFFKQLGDIFRVLLQKTDLGLAKDMKQFDDFNFLNTMLFSLNQHNLADNLKTMRLIIAYCDVKILMYPTPVRLFSSYLTPAERFRELCQQLLFLHPLLARCDQLLLEEANVGRLSRSPIAYRLN